jgi:hypothetical protein
MPKTKTKSRRNQSRKATTIRSDFANKKAHSWVRLKLENDALKGKKLTAAQPIKLGDVVLTYEGVLTNTNGGIDLERGGNYSMYVKFNQKKWKLDAGQTPDARFGYGRYINHSSAHPNLTWKVAPDPANPAVPFVYFVAKKDIEKGDELLFDYFQGTKPTAAEKAAFPWL